MKIGKCAWCGEKGALTFHHLKPKIEGKRRQKEKGVYICEECRTKIHIKDNVELFHMTAKAQRNYVLSMK